MLAGGPSMSTGSGLSTSTSRAFLAMAQVS